MFDDDREIILRTISPRDILAHQEEFVAIAADVPGEYWSLQNFLMELPAKWDLSFALWQNGLPIGYAILSQKPDNQAHLHHLMINHAHRAKGWGTRMITEMIARARAAGATLLTLKAERSNADALRFYSRNGFSRQAEDGDFVVLAASLDSTPVAIHGPNNLP
jgi:ribosomal protein S18 acetylase RimI-like enzyme